MPVIIMLNLPSFAGAIHNTLIHYFVSQINEKSQLFTHSDIFISFIRQRDDFISEMLTKNVTLVYCLSYTENEKKHNNVKETERQKQ